MQTQTQSRESSTEMESACLHQMRMMVNIERARRDGAARARRFSIYFYSIVAIHLVYIFDFYLDAAALDCAFRIDSTVSMTSSNRMYSAKYASCLVTLASLSFWISANLL